VSDAVAISSDDGENCALIAGGDVECRGSDEAGQIGNSTIGQRSPTPAFVAPSGVARIVSRGT